jgi:phytepsin
LYKLLDTGSADLWIVSDICKNCNASKVPLYPQSSFQASGLNIDLRYGDSRTGTHASGSIGKDSVSIAGLALDDQFLASINDTDTAVTESGSAGILGLGFPGIR